MNMNVPEMDIDIDEVDNLTLATNVTETDYEVASPGAQACANEATTTKRKFPYQGHGGGQDKVTQTPGHVFLGKQGEVIITTNYTLVKLVINDDAVRTLTQSTAAHIASQVTDTIMASLVRLDWNGERILDRAMTSFRLTLTNDNMSQLIKDVINIVQTEQDHHRVQLLAEQLFKQRITKLFGIDVRSIVFILEHCSVDDAKATLQSPQLQEELKQIFLNFLPGWIAPFAVWSISSYSLTVEDQASMFGFENITEVAFSDLSNSLESFQASPSSSSAEGCTLMEDVEESVPWTESPHLEANTPEALSKRSSVPAPSVVVDTASATEAASSSSTEKEQPSTSYKAFRRKPESSSVSKEEAEMKYLGGGLSGKDGTPSDTQQQSSISGVSPELKFSRLEDIDTDDIPEPKVDFRFIVLGKTGSGKSSTGNTILGQDWFPTSLSFSSITTQCQVASAMVGGVLIEVMDSPGLFDTTMTTENVSNMVMSAVSHMQDGPDAVFYVIPIGGRYTDEEFAVFQLLKALLDDSVMDYMAIIFTFADTLKGCKFEDMLSTRVPPRLKMVMEECGNRYVVFDNTASNKQPQVDRVLTIVKQMKKKNHGRRYRCPKYAEKLDEIDLELQMRLVKAEQERLKGKTYIQTLTSQVLLAEEELKKERERFAQQEKELEEKMKDMEQSKQREISLWEGQMMQMEEEDKKRQMQDLQENLERIQKQLQLELKEQHRKHEREKEEREQMLEKLQKERQAQEKAIAESRRQQMEELRREVAYSRRRRKADCRIM